MCVYVCVCVREQKKTKELGKTRERGREVVGQGERANVSLLSVLALLLPGILVFNNRLLKDSRARHLLSSITKA